MVIKNNVIVSYVSEALFLKPEKIENYIKTAHYRYKKYQIPKRSGKGFRKIAQPSRGLKNIQKMVIDKFFFDLPIHENAMAYVKGKNIKDNAAAHSENTYVLKMDFEDFFHSIKPEDFISHIKKHSEFKIDKFEKRIISSLFFYKKERSDKELCLSIGAPTSPFISNTIMYDFDKKISGLCEKKGVAFTRYADDLTFSTKNDQVLSVISEEVLNIIQKLSYPSLKINDKKTVFLSKKGNRHVTGLVLTNDNKVSIGYSKKREIRSMIHKFMNRKLENREIAYLSGYISFCNSVEPGFVVKLKIKYGEDVVSNLLRKKIYDD